MSSIIKRPLVIDADDIKVVAFADEIPQEKEKTTDKQQFGLEAETHEPLQFKQEKEPVLELEKAIDPEQQKKEMEAIIQETESIVRELMEKAKQEARSIIEKAQNEADEKLGAALQEKEKVLEEAKNSGYEQGLKSAQQDIEADRQLAMEQCENILAEARRNKLKIMESSVADMARLVMLIAKKIIATEIITNPEVIVNIIREAVGFLDKPDNIQIYLNPEDLEKITAQIVNQNLNDNSIHTEAVELIGDKNICPGGCVVESDVGSIDAQLETRLENIERAVWEAAVDEYNEHAEHE